MSDVSKDLVNFLDSDLTLNLKKGINLYLGPVRDATNVIPDNAVFVSSRGGRLPHRVMGLSSEVRFPIVFIRVRNVNYEVGHDLARAIMNILMISKIPGYLDLEPLQSEP